MEGVEEADKYMRSAKLLKDMRRDYEHFQNQLCCLGKIKRFSRNISVDKRR